MKNILIIGLIIVSLGYMFSLLFDRYEATINEQAIQKNINKK